MPRPPFPNAIRAVLGFPFGMFVGLLILAIVRRFIQGIDAFFIDVEMLGILGMDGFFAGNFWDDEATFMFALLAGTAGFLWGAGATYDFQKEEKLRSEQKSLALAARIPEDPDAPHSQNSPLFAMLGAVPGIILTTIGMVITVILIVAIVQAGFGGEQTTVSGAERDEFGTGDINILDGTIEFEAADQATAFFVFSAIVLSGVIGTGLVIALVVWLLNREVSVAKELEPNPDSGQDFILVRLVGFFTTWAVDILNGVRTILTPR